MDKKRSKKSRIKPLRLVPKKPQPEPEHEIEALRRELTEALEQQTATSEVLRVIASSPSELQPVLDALAESAARLCEAVNASIWQLDGDVLRRVAHHGSLLYPGETVPLGRGFVPSRAVIDRQTIHVHDLAAEVETEFPESRSAQKAAGVRTMLATPLLREGIPLGVITIRRAEVRPFNGKQIALLKTFADQAVIAIENVRLFQESQTRNRELMEALEQQTATSEILRIISSTPTDVQPVFDAIVQSGIRLFEGAAVTIVLPEGDQARAVAIADRDPERCAQWLKRFPVPLTREYMHSAAILDGRMIDVPDAAQATDTFAPGRRNFLASGYRAVTIAPMLRDGKAIGAISVVRLSPGPLSEKQIALLKTFADQAVIAIENVRLFQELQARNRDLTEALEQQTATSEILRVIASSPTDIQPVLKTIAENAAQLCEANDALIYQVEGRVMRRVVHFGPVPMAEGMEIREITPESANGYAIIERQTIHVHDLLDEQTRERYPESVRLQKLVGHRTVLVTPLVREGVAVGTIVIRRMEVCPFSEKQISLLETFADQAVIAIENVRLFKELQARNRDLTEALEQQTATGEVLRVIASSPTELQPVLDALLANAVKLSGATTGHIRQFDGEFFRYVSHYNESPELIDALNQLPQRPRRESMSTRAMLEKKPVHILDAQVEPNYRAPRAQAQARTMLYVPLLREGSGIGTITIWRDFVEPFTERQIELVKTFADQGVIAIENVRLFQELTEALEQQTATSQILGVIASSPTEIQPVLDVVAQNAAQLCEAKDAQILRVEGDILRWVAGVGSVPHAIDTSGAAISRGHPTGRAIIEKQTFHVHDITAEFETEFPESRLLQQVSGARTILVTPLLREDEAIGCITIRRTEVRPFTDKQIALLKTFADQAVIAIENVRLFKELQERNAELREALEHQTATAEVLGIISRSPTDVQPVLDAIVASAARVCGIDDVLLRLREGNTLVARAHFGPIAIGRIEISIDEPQFRWVCEHGTLHVPDVRAQNDFPMWGIAGGWRTVVAVPLRQQGELVGSLSARRIEVRPFTPAQIKLLETFADQAVIAIENVRLFQELQARNREVTEALEQQTATGEILRTISSSPIDVQPVFEAIASSAAKLCEAELSAVYRYDGELIHVVANTLRSKEQRKAFEQLYPMPPSRGTPVARAILECRTQYVRDTRDDPEYLAALMRTGFRSALAVPMLREGTPIGAIAVGRMQVREFTDKQVALLQTFADQAVIAIENVRLFQELQTRNRQLTEALEQQTATSEILRVIASSPTDVQPVLDTLVESAARLCDTDDAAICTIVGDQVPIVAHHGFVAGSTPITVPMSRDSVTGRSILERKTVLVDDWEKVPPEEFPTGAELARVHGVRMTLATPMLKEGVAIGTIVIRRREYRPFTDSQIKLLETFADQAVIAIENVRLFQELQARNRDLTEALEQQTATSEILRVIASSPTDIQPVLEVVAENAARLCEANDAQIYRLDGDVLRRVAVYGEIPAGQVGEERAVDRGWLSGRAVVDQRAIHVHDLEAEPEAEFPLAKAYQKHVGARTRTVLAMPLMREGVPIGTIAIRRLEVRPFTDKQIALLKTFSDQAVIAIENVRLFQELKESLEQQTATSEILGVIASSPTDIQPVLDVVAENAARVCSAEDATIRLVEGNVHRRVAHKGIIPATQLSELPIDRGSVTGRVIVDRKLVHIEDLMAVVATEFPEARDSAEREGIRTVLAAPLLREGIAIGAINIRRTEVRPFTDRQIQLLETFADQAVIAIENVRLFQELTEALEQQTATSQILGVIASSPTDIQPVLDAVAENAARLCEANDAVIFRIDGDTLQRAAIYGSIPVPPSPPPITRGTPIGRAVVDRCTIHVHDLAAEVETEFPEGKTRQALTGVRTVLATPLMREGIPLGAIWIRRTEVRPFTDSQVKLLETFADQAVIAIENVRLFQELDARTRELARSVGELKALGEVGQTVSSTLDLQTVLSTIVGHAVQLSGASGGVVYEYDEAKQEFHLRASQRMEDEVVEALKVTPVRPGQGATGQAATTRAPVQVPNIVEQRESTATSVRPILARLGYRSVLAVPLLREDRILGALTVWRKEAGSFSSEVVNLLQTFATQSALAIQNARLFREIEDKGRQLEAANRHKSEFLANVSHELRTPLNAIIGFSEVLGERMFGELNEKQAEYTEDILSSGRHLLSLINDILDLSKIEAGRMELDLAKFDLPSALENALILVRERAARHGIKLERVIDERLGEFTGDERKVKQILVNLLSNAVKFTPEGGQIRVNAGLGDGAAIISVADTGIGIAPEDHEAIFEEFRQVGTNYAQKREGTGLGLALTKKFVDMHGGKIWVDSAPGKGATFTFTLPIR